jgi:hypothetical protein
VFGSRRSRRRRSRRVKDQIGLGSPGVPGVTGWAGEGSLAFASTRALPVYHRAHSLCLSMRTGADSVPVSLMRHRLNGTVSMRTGAVCYNKHTPVLIQQHRPCPRCVELCPNPVLHRCSTTSTRLPACESELTTASGLETDCPGCNRVGRGKLIGPGETGWAVRTCPVLTSLTSLRPCPRQTTGSLARPWAGEDQQAEQTRWIQKCTEMARVVDQIGRLTCCMLPDRHPESMLRDN